MNNNNKTIPPIHPTLDNTFIVGGLNPATQKIKDQEDKEAASNNLHLMNLGMNLESVFDVSKEFPTKDDVKDVIKDIMVSWFSKSKWILIEERENELKYENPITKTIILFFIDTKITRYFPAFKLAIIIEVNKLGRNIKDTAEVQIRHGIIDKTEFEKKIVIELSKLLNQPKNIKDNL